MERKKTKTGSKMFSLWLAFLLLATTVLFTGVSSQAFAAETTSEQAGRWAQSIVENTEIVDANFAAAIAESLEAHGGYTDADFAPDAVTATLQNYSGEIINAANRGIRSIEGIGVLTNISGLLDISNNKIADMQPLHGVIFRNADFHNIDLTENPVLNYPSLGHMSPSVLAEKSTMGVRCFTTASYLYGTTATQTIPYLFTIDYQTP